MKVLARELTTRCGGFALAIIYTNYILKTGAVLLKD